MVQTAASGRLLSSLRSGWRVPAALQRLYADAAWLQQLAIEELRPRPGRIRTSLRMAFSPRSERRLWRRCTSAVCWVRVRSGWLFMHPARLMTPSEGLIMVLVFAVTLIASVFLAGVLVDAPWLLLPFFGLATALIFYALNKRRLVGAWFNVLVGFLDTFYLCVFDPQNFGWSVAYIVSTASPSRSRCSPLRSIWFYGRIRPSRSCCARWQILSIATANDWPRSVLPILIHSPQPCCLSPHVVSILPVQLPLLERARRGLKNPRREAILLAALDTAERLHIEIERLLAIARDHVPARHPHASAARDGSSAPGSHCPSASGPGPRGGHRVKGRVEDSGI